MADNAPKINVRLIQATQDIDHAFGAMPKGYLVWYDADRALPMGWDYAPAYLEEQARHVAQQEITLHGW